MDKNNTIEKDTQESKTYDEATFYFEQDLLKSINGCGLAITTISLVLKNILSEVNIKKDEIIRNIINK